GGDTDRDASPAGEQQPDPPCSCCLGEEGDLVSDRPRARWRVAFGERTVLSEQPQHIAVYAGLVGAVPIGEAGQPAGQPRWVHLDPPATTRRRPGTHPPRLPRW